MDIKITNWIFEYFRQPLEDQALNSQLLSYLQKTFLLNRLELDLSRRSVSETMLDLMEQLEEIEKRAVSDALKRAYCAVAVDCTLNLLKAGRRQPAVYLKFIEMVKRVWRGRIGSMKKSVENGGLGLGSEVLWGWKEEIEGAVWDDSLCESMMSKFNEGKAEEEVGFYLREEREKMVPCFLELVAEKMKSDKWVQEILGETTARVAPDSSEVKEILGVAPDEVEEINGESARAAESSSSPQQVKEILESGPEVDSAREALGWSSTELLEAIKDPLPFPKAENNDVILIVDGDDGTVQSNHDMNRLEEKRSAEELDESLPLKRVKRRGWSILEEDTLREGVSKYGHGSWKVILTSYRHIFKGRTDVNLKDKWRNMMR